MFFDLAMKQSMKKTGREVSYPYIHVYIYIYDIYIYMRYIYIYIYVIYIYIHIHAVKSHRPCHFSELED